MNAEPSPDPRRPLDAAALRRALVEGPGAPYAALDVVDEIGSTNAELLRRAGAEGASDRSVLLAELQTSGRGRLGRAWTAPPGTQVAVSVLLRPGAVSPTLFGWLPLVTGLAVRDALAAEGGVDATLKWPNDVLVDGRKLAGILIESRLGAENRVVVIGIGLNVGMTSFPAGLRQAATSLRLAAPHPPARAALASALLDSLHRTARLAFHGWEELRARFHQRDAFRGVRLRAESAGGACEGTGAGIDGEGCFRITRADGRTETLRDAHSLTPLASR